MHTYHKRVIFYAFSTLNVTHMRKGTSLSPVLGKAWRQARLASSPGSLRVSHWRAWYFFLRDLTYIIAREQDRSKDWCASLPFAGDSVSTLSLWYKRAPKSSYKKCRFAAFLCFLKTAAVFAHAKFYPSTTLVPSASRT